MDLGMDLFATAEKNDSKKYEPLAQRMRPRNFDEFIGQEEAVGKGKYLRKMIERDQLPSMILYGPPGTGKTTLAQMVASLTNSNFKKLNAVSAGIGDIRKIVDEAAEARRFYQKRTIVFIDEIHRFNKSQQDVLLPYVEDGRLILIGATTENPFFEVNHALLSRVRIVRLSSLSDRDLMRMLKQAMEDKERGLGSRNLNITDESVEAIAQLSGGDGRMALNLLEQAAAMIEDGGEINIELLHTILGERIQTYDKKGDNHYDTVSAFIKSMRGSDPDAAIHYLARMLAAGEDLNFIARRVAICAAEDVGNADPFALVVAMAAVQAVQFVGMPEARIPLAEAVTYVASAPKSNAAYMAIDAALADVRHRNCGPVPEHLRDAHYKEAAKLGHGINYKYAHDFPYHFVKQQYLPNNLKGTTYYHPTANGREVRIGEYLKACWPERYK
ncbi:replication-associated recombination protein A [Anaerovibrio sp.]|uniref:replication-associated recombination protein A n=1 Tax=Anaerovibrio sp. TaxID=1872532 RepID=UPI00257A45CC|nr:replication-associated recombination protein A [Anaerovibrio sp.]